MATIDPRLKKIYETRKYLLDEIKQNDLMSEKHKNMCRALNYFEYFLISFLLSRVMSQFLHLLS